MTTPWGWESARGNRSLIHCIPGLNQFLCRVLAVALVMR